MGREQGDHLGDETVTWYVGTVNGVEHERPATAPAEHINLKARGWVTKESLGRENGPDTSSASPASPGSTGALTTGVQPSSSTPSGSETGPNGSEPVAPPDSTNSTTDPGPEEGPAPAARRGGKRAPDVQSAAPQDEAAAAAGEAG